MVHQKTLIGVMFVIQVHSNSCCGLESALDVSAENFILALKRFISFRGKLKRITDKNFKSLKVKLLKHFFKHKIEWKYILERRQS